MTCTQFRDSLDGYIDRELAPDAMAAANEHRATCAACDRIATRMLEMKASVRDAVGAAVLPHDLESRIRASLPPQWQIRRWLASAAAALVVLGTLIGVAGRTNVGTDAANVMDRLALRLDDSSAVVLEGTLLCRDCELEHRYGIEAPCRTIGHHGAIATDDGRIWNLVEQTAAAELIHNKSLLGRRVVVEGRVFRGARAIVIERYQLES